MQIYAMRPCARLACLCLVLLPASYATAVPPAVRKLSKLHADAQNAQQKSTVVAETTPHAKVAHSDHISVDRHRGVPLAASSPVTKRSPLRAATHVTSDGMVSVASEAKGNHPLATAESVHGVSSETLLEPEETHSAASLMQTVADAGSPSERSSRKKALMRTMRTELVMGTAGGSTAPVVAVGGGDAGGGGGGGGGGADAGAPVVTAAGPAGGGGGGGSIDASPMASDEPSPDTINAATPKDCEWGEWKEWDDCSESCGDGTKERKREMTRGASDGGEECTGPSKETRDCNEKACESGGDTTTTPAPAIHKRKSSMAFFGIVAIALVGGGGVAAAQANQKPELDEFGEPIVSDVHGNDDYGYDADETY